MITQAVYDSFKNSLLSGDRHSCAEITKALFTSTAAVKEVYVDLFQAAMYEIGDMWEHDLITPATEHLATGITEYCMSFAYPVIFGAEHKNKCAVISCLPNEYHQIGARMVADFFELNGWHGYFLGANTPINALLEMIGEKKPDVVGLSISIYFNVPVMLKVIDAIRGKYKDLRIIVGGQGLKHGAGMAGKLGDVEIVGSLDSLEKIFNES